ncbi:MAG: hypothetical protein ABIW82_06750 [Dokdonella sp.]
MSNTVGLHDELNRHKRHLHEEIWLVLRKALTRNFLSVCDDPNATRPCLIDIAGEPMGRIGTKRKPRDGNILKIGTSRLTMARTSQDACEVMVLELQHG